MSFSEADRVNPKGFTGRDGFDPSQHPRATDGTFSEKVGAAPGISLENKPPLNAKIVHQVWNGDYAVETGEETEFDIRAVLDAASLDDIRSMDSSGDRDWLHDDAVNAGLIESAHGPYYVDTFYIEEQLEEYIAEREAAGQEDPIADLQPSQSLVRERAGAMMLAIRGEVPLSIATLDTPSAPAITADGIVRMQRHLNSMPVDPSRLDATDAAQLDAIDSLYKLIEHRGSEKSIVPPQHMPEVVRTLAQYNDYLWNRAATLAKADQQAAAE